MLKSIAAFELRYQLRQPLFYICFGIFFLLTFGAITTDSVQIGGSIGNVNRNAPFVIMFISAVMSVIAVFATTAFVATSVQRDYEYDTWPLFFSKPISPTAYLGGRFAGSVTVALLTMFGVLAGILVGSKMPWLEAERIGPTLLSPYAFSFFVLILPNIVLTGALFFAVATMTRNLLGTYAAVAGFFVAYLVSQAVLGDVENQAVASLLDPFGVSAYQLATRYWTVFDKNGGALSLSGPLLYNRLLWLAVSAIVLFVANRRFTFAAAGVQSRGKKKRVLEEAAPRVVFLPNVAPLVREASQTFGGFASWRQYFSATGIELRSLLKSVGFIVLLFFGVLNIVGNSVGLDDLYGTSVWPVTSLMVRVISGAFFLFVLIIITFYSGETMWRERQLKVSDVYDSLPTPTWISWLSKLTALSAAAAILLGVAMLTGMAIQLFRGYSHFEPSLYFQGLFLDFGSQLLLIIVFALFLQVIANHKFLGMFLMVLYYVALAALPALHFEHHLYLFGTTPSSTYSDMNGYGHFVRPIVWFTIYWALFSVLLMVIAHLLWPRGSETSWRARLRIAAQRWNGKTLAVTGLTLVAFAGTGAFIFHNTNVLNRYQTRDEREKEQAEFEKRYKRYENVPQPRITDVRVNVDIDPEHRSARLDGVYALVNRTNAAIRDLHFWVNPDVTIDKLDFPGRFRYIDKKRGYYIAELTNPLPAGAAMNVSYAISVVNRGFRNDNEDDHIVVNGTFFNSNDYLPHIGYVRENELQDRNKRRKYGLPPLQRMAKVTDIRARGNTYISREADWIHLDTTVSTAGNQTAVAPGYLQREWRQNGRHYFHYKMDAPILDFYSWLSADYKVRRDHWKDVAIEIYYDEKHPYNVDKMIEAVKASLDYYTTNFSPYQHRQVRILEFPRYARFAQSFPNTIPFSESMGFIANLKDKEAIDYVYYVTAHEVGHQWWAHQVIGADTQGSTMLSETMAQYSALMVMEKRYGKDKMRRFLKYELDNYLRGRGGELVAETPLLYVEDQPYIHYRKGSLVMYALRDLIGEENLNRALRAYIAKTAFQQPPYTVSPELLAEIRKVTPPQDQQAVTDMFEKITIYENQAKEVKTEKRADGKYAVTMTVTAKKLYADDRGRETGAALREWIDIGVLAPKDPKTKEEKTLYLERKLIDKPEMTFTVVVNEKPGKAGIDPYNKLIDRNPDDNLKAAE